MIAMNGKVSHITEVTEELVDMPGSKKTYIQWLITKDDGAPHFAMRRFRVLPGGYSPLHSHGHEHEVYVLQGKGQVLLGEKKYELKPGSFVFVPPMEKHQFVNTSDTEELIFLCIIPHIHH